MNSNMSNGMNNGMNGQISRRSWNSMCFGGRIWMMKKLMLIVFCSVFLCSNFAFAEVLPTKLLITELQTGTTTSSNQEFIEIYNSSLATINLTDYKLEYFTASSSSTTASWAVDLSGELPANDYFLLARKDYLPDTKDIEFTSALADTGGYVRIVQKSTSGVIDGLGWGGSTRFEGHSAPAPAKNESLARIMNQDLYIDTDNNLSDFNMLESPNPAMLNYVFVPEPDTPPPNEAETTESEVTETETLPEVISDPEPVPAVPTSELLEPYITELLPNPASPLTDADDEYVEIYNPNETPFDLSGYKIQAGNTYSYSYVINGVTIPAKSYIAFYSKDNGLTLSNTSSKARLLDPSGQTVSETDPYSDAEEGSVWQLYAGVWQWSTTGSPGVLNVQTLPTVLSTISAVSAKKPKTTKAAAPKATKAKLASAKTTAAKKTAKKDEKGPTNNFHEEGSSGDASAHAWYGRTACVIIWCI
ncbi:MAG: lamin tail domain-containing protein [Patescibacteria group bacterium]